MLIYIAVWAVFGIMAILAVRALWASRRAEPGSGRLWPTAVALGLALLSWPQVALSLDVKTSAGIWSGIEPPVLSRWTAALSAVLTSALVAGTLGGPLTRRHAVIGAAFTFVLALLVAIPALPMLPAVFGMDIGAGWFCWDGCQAITNTNDLRWGLIADLWFPLAFVYDPVPVLTLAVGVGLWTRLIRGWYGPRSRRREANAEGDQR